MGVAYVLPPPSRPPHPHFEAWFDESSPTQFDCASLGFYGVYSFFLAFSISGVTWFDSRFLFFTISDRIGFVGESFFPINLTLAGVELVYPRSCRSPYHFFQPNLLHHFQCFIRPSVYDHAFIDADRRGIVPPIVSDRLYLVLASWFEAFSVRFVCFSADDRSWDPFRCAYNEHRWWIQAIRYFSCFVYTILYMCKFWYF